MTKESLYNAGDRIQFWHDKHRCSGTILERNLFLESLAGNIHYTVRVDTVATSPYASEKPLKVGAVWCVKNSEIVGCTL